MKKTLFALMACAAIFAGCKKSTPMTPEQERNTIEQAANQLATYVDVPNWSDDIDVIAGAYKTLEQIDNTDALMPLVTYIKEVFEKTVVTKDDVIYTTLLASSYNGVLVVTKDAMGEYQGNFTPKQDGGLYIYYPNEKYGTCAVAARVDDSRIAAKYTIVNEGDETENVLTINIPMAASASVTVNGVSRVGLSIYCDSDRRGEEINFLEDRLAIRASLHAGKYALDIAASESNVSTGSVSEQLCCDGKLVESIKASLYDANFFAELPQFGTAAVEINVCDLVAIKGNSDLNKFIPLVQEYDFEQTYDKKDEADAFAAKLTDALVLNVYNNNNLNYVQAKVVFAAVDNIDPEVTGKYVIRPILVFADGSRNTFEEFFKEDFIERLTNIFDALMERIEKKLGDLVDEK